MSELIGVAAKARLDFDAAFLATDLTFATADRVEDFFLRLTRELFKADFARVPLPERFFAVVTGFLPVDFFKDAPFILKRLRTMIQFVMREASIPRCKSNRQERIRSPVSIGQWSCLERMRLVEFVAIDTTCPVP